MDGRNGWMDSKSFLLGLLISLVFMGFLRGSVFKLGRIYDYALKHPREDPYC